MRKYLLAGAAALVMATPAAATTDHAGYVGVEGGILFPKSQNIDGVVDFTSGAAVDIARTHVGDLRYKKGLDLDFIGGYDFGMFRVEGELGYKRAGARNFDFGTGDNIVTFIDAGSGNTFTTSDLNLSQSTRIYSGMVNGLLDFGGNGHFGGYLGGGIGYASVRQFGSSQGKLAWQAIAGVYAPITDNIDLGLKYRYFRTGRTHASRTFPFTATAGPCTNDLGTFTCSSGVATFTDGGNFQSSSFLASLVYNFGVAAAPPPPPPPATQTCPDGSVILATSTCPAPPPPPPPPPAPVERGERGQ